MIYCPLGKSVNNRVPTYPLKSLIRAYSGPNFVMDGESYLPYSPDHLAIIAMLEDISPVVKVDGKAVTQTDSREARTVRPGQTISTDPGASVTVYFSDGSVTYMDEKSELLIQPNTQVEKNDKDGIATKIRLKLLQGSIWNKVIRLAEKSEFNIETTSAIAGVRGTEFGISAEGDEMVVKSGSVAARKKTSDEYDSTVQIIIDKNDSFPTANVTGDVTKFTVFSIPSENETISPASNQPSSFDAYDKYYLQPYNNNLEPRLNEINVPTNSLSFRLLQDPLSEPHLLPLKKILVYEEKDMGSLVSTWDIGTHFVVDSQMNTAVISDSVLTDFFTTPNFERSFIFYFEDSSGNRSAPSHPAIMVQQNAFLTYAMLHGDETYVSQQSGQGQVGGNCTGDLLNIVVQGPDVMTENSSATYTAWGHYSEPPMCSEKVTPQCVWEVAGQGTMSGNVYFALGGSGSAVLFCSIGTVKGYLSPAVSYITKLNATCWGVDLKEGGGDDKGYWSDPACWVMADENNPEQNCNYACNSQLAATCENFAPPAPNWDDDGKNICLALANSPNPPISPLPISPSPIQESDANHEFAPYLIYLSGSKANCQARISGIEPSDLCAQEPIAQIQHRICRCI